MAGVSHQTTFSGSHNHGLQMGQNSGTVTYEPHYHHPQQQNLHPVRRCLSHARDRDYVDHGTYLADLLARGPGNRAAMVGLGGVGKSQLAIEFAYRLREQSPETWVFWVHASNAARFKQGLGYVADEAKIVGRHDPQADIVKLVRDWLRESKQPWVVILDNLDDARFLHTPDQEQSVDLKGQAARLLSDFLPQTQNGSLLITSRSRKVALEFVEASDVATIEPMMQTDATRLLKKKLGDSGDSQNVTELAAALEFMPLAIIQAAAYIFERAPRYSVSQYLNAFHRSDHEKGSLLDHASGALRRDKDAKNSIIITWQISFDHIRATMPAAAELLSLMSFFDRQGIAEALLKPDSKQLVAPQNETRGSRARSSWNNRNNEAMGNPRADSQVDVNTFEESVLTLRNYSLIKINEDAKGFEMHRLVQFAVREWLDINDQLERYKQQYISNLDSVLPTAKYKNWELCQTLFPHAKAALSQQPEERDSSIKWISVLYKAVWYATERQNYSDAEMIAEKAISTGEKILGIQDKRMIELMNFMAKIYRRQGRLKEAEELDVRMVETCKTVLRDEHPSPLGSLNNLASTYRRQGRFKEAETLHLQVIEMGERLYGAEHGVTLHGMSNLALTYGNQGRREEAEKLQVRLLETRRRLYGAEHPRVLFSMHNLACFLMAQGKITEAVELMAECVSLMTRVLGTDHPDTVLCSERLLKWRRGRDEPS